MLFVFKKYISNKSYTSSVDTMSLKSGDPEYENLISTYYGKNEVNAIITLKVDTKEVDKIATKISKFECIVDIYLVTGDTDIILKSKFKDYNELKDFVLHTLGALSGIRDTKTLMIITTFKEGGKKKED
jgi:DNA-binding Lrp family transcriptional regulator